MSPDRDLAPLLDLPDTPSPVREALSRARAGLPSPDNLARLAARLPLSPGGSGGSGGPPGPGGAPSTPPGAPSTGGAPAGSGAPQAAASWLFPGAMCGTAIGIVIAGAIAAFSPGSHRGSAPSKVPSPESHAAALAPTQGASSPSPSPSLSPLPGTSTSAPARLKASVKTGDLPTRSAAVVPAAVVPAAVVPVESESLLLQRARDALAKDPARALAIVERHRAVYPRGMLSQERELLALKALTALGRPADARTRAAAFVTAYPSSAYRDRVESLARPEPR